jgi:hypothetical protein
MEAEKAKKTRRKKAEKSGTARRTIRRSKGRKTIAEKETTTKQVIRVKDINELVNYCERFFNRKPFEGASVDFHPKKPAFIFIPNDNAVTKVDAQRLLDLLKERNITSVLVDALNKKKVSVLAELCNAGIEVYVLRRPGYIKRMREELERYGIKVPKTDKYDAVLLAFTPPRKWALVDAKFLKAWKAMTEWRYADTTFRVEQQRYDANNSEGPKEDDEELKRIKELVRAKLEEVQRLLEEVQKLEAKLFVRKVQMLYPEVDFDKDFEEFGIKDDDIAKAYFCEALLEAMNCDWLAGYLVKSGIGVTGSPPPKQRKKEYIYDGRLKHVLNQLAVKVYHLDIYDENDRKKVKPKARKLAEKIWKRARRIKKWIEGGRVGEASGPAPLEKREGSALIIPVHRLSSPSEGRGLLRKQEFERYHPALGPKHPAVLITTLP